FPREIQDSEKTFATLLLIDRPDAVGIFIDRGICDAALPLTTGSLEDLVGPQSKAWTIQPSIGFEEMQWKALSPVFHVAHGRHTIPHYKFRDKDILPFTHQEHFCSGAHGQVFRVKLHPNHHNFDCISKPGLQTKYFAVKRLHKRGEFLEERGMLKRINHPHAIALLATYEYCNHFHFILPWAECNLAEYWETKNPNPEHDLSTLMWMAEQCRGIADGLSPLHHHATNTSSSLFRGPSVVLGPTAPDDHDTQSTDVDPHQFFGRHGDIKPLNLLWFPQSRDSREMRIIKISGFGEGEFNKTELTRRSPNSIAYTPTYRPPECDHPDLEIQVSATYDTWPLGCLYLEFVTWFVGGWEKVHEFERSRRGGGWSHREATFFELTGDLEPYAVVKSAVKQVCRHDLQTVA
ncbi:kinase-like domain-containing protein, partial [Lasiosphaeria hispida]